MGSPGLLLSVSPVLTKGTLKNLWLCEMTGRFSEARVGLLPSYIQEKN
jgi:hypothetical protein